MKMGEYPPAIAGNGQEKGTKKQLKIVKDGTSARGGGWGWSKQRMEHGTSWWCHDGMKKGRNCDACAKTFEEDNEVGTGQ
jgi:hypothetical protein